MIVVAVSRLMAYTRRALLAPRSGSSVLAWFGSDTGRWRTVSEIRLSHGASLTAGRSMESARGSLPFLQVALDLPKACALVRPVRQTAHEMAAVRVWRMRLARVAASPRHAGTARYPAGP